MIINFFVPGIPSGQPRQKACIRGKHAGTYTPSGDHDNWRELVLIAAQENKPTAPFDGPIALEVVFTMPRPKAHYNKKGLKGNAPSYHTGRPDADNLIKLVMDALTQAWFWRDDAQVCKFEARKIYGETPGAAIRVSG